MSSPEKRIRTIAVLLLTGVSSIGRPQDARTIRIPDEVSCLSCRITVNPTVTFGDLDGPGALAGPPTGIRVDGQRRFWVWAHDAGGPAIFDAGGRFLRVAGRRGKGPGEFEIVADVVPLPGDSVLVMGSDRRATLFSPDLTAVRHILLGATLSRSVVVRWPHSIIGFSEYGAGGRAGPVLHSMSFDSAPANVTRSFGPTWTVRDIRTMEIALRVMAPSATGLWAALPHAHQIEHWTADGRNDVMLERVPPWPSRTSGGLGTPDTPPPNSIQAVADYGDGRLWTFINVAAPTWKEGWPRVAGEYRASAFSYEKMLRTLVEVLDPTTGRVLARRQLDEWIIAGLPGGRAAIYTVGVDDIPRLRVVTLTLEGLR